VTQPSRFHLWEKVEITLEARNSYSNEPQEERRAGVHLLPSPYSEVEVWVDLRGPGFDKRVQGFWDGGNIFRVRVVATAPGEWTWTSGSNQPAAAGLNGKTGRFTAVEWTEDEKRENLCRRGFLRATANRHALEHADGTPFFLLGDTWWSTPTFRCKWYDDDSERPLGPEMGFKDMVRFRRAQGFNSIAIIAAFPHWANDGRPAIISLEDGTPLRDAWPHPVTGSAKDMHNEGGRPFLFPGRVPGYENLFPDVDRINPAYFQFLDRKIDYLNAQGFIPFIEAARRDVAAAWKKFYDWPASYARYVRYIFARYQANNCLLSPVHYDWIEMTLPPWEFNEPANLVIEKYGPPPFGTLLSANCSPSTLVNFGGPDKAKWLTLHQIGNWREHYNNWYLTEIFNAPNPSPALNGEPYYAGFTGPPGGTEEDDLYCRSGMYGGFLSGGLGGCIYGAQGIWDGAVEAEAKNKMWDSLTWDSAKQVKHFREFVFSQGERYQELIPNSELLIPNKSGDSYGYTGWAYCAHTEKKDLFLIYFEKDCPQARMRGAIPFASYQANWFNPRTGEWGEVGDLKADVVGMIALPLFPSNNDWAMTLALRKR